MKLYLGKTNNPMTLNCTEKGCWIKDRFGEAFVWRPYDPPVTREWPVKGMWGIYAFGVFIGIMHIKKPS